MGQSTQTRTRIGYGYLEHFTGTGLITQIDDTQTIKADQNLQTNVTYKALSPGRRPPLTGFECAVPAKDLDLEPDRSSNEDKLNDTKQAPARAEDMKSGFLELLADTGLLTELRHMCVDYDIVNNNADQSLADTVTAKKYVTNEATEALIAGRAGDERNPSLMTR